MKRPTIADLPDPPQGALLPGYMDDPQLRKEHGAFARRCVEKLFSRGDVIAQIYKGYEESLISGRRNSGPSSSY
jgi:hypothetical protein